jgi:hypothetical protein
LTLSNRWTLSSDFDHHETVFVKKTRRRRWDSKARVIGRSKLESANGKPAPTARVAVRSTAGGVNVARGKVNFVLRHGAEIHSARSTRIAEANLASPRHPPPPEGGCRLKCLKESLAGQVRDLAPRIGERIGSAVA